MSLNPAFRGLSTDSEQADELLLGRNVWPSGGLANDFEEQLINRDSSGTRMSLHEFELAPHKASNEINLIEASRWLDPYHPCNRAIFASYLSVGFGLFFISTPLAFYMVDTLKLEPATQAVITGLLSLPWALKILFGFLSDAVPIFGLRRKPYFLFGWAVFAASNIVLAVSTTPGTYLLAACLFLMTLGFVQADVCTDAMIVERSKIYEHTGNQGTLQARGYITRFAGAIFGAAAGAVLYNKASWGWGLPIYIIFAINAAVPIVFIVPFFWTLVEVKADSPPVVSSQLRSIWELVQKRAVWKPCSFIYIYNVLLLTNPAWNSFLVAGLGFSNFDIGLLTLAGAILSYIALVVYKRYLFNVSWRIIYIFTTALSFLFSCLQLVLVFRLNTKIGMTSVASELVFAMGSYGVVMFVSAIQFLPACRMFLGMCPEGTEGSSYAMLTTLSNLAGTVAYSVAAACASIWDVSIPTLKNQDFSGMWKLTLLCGSVQICGLLFVGLLPSGVAEQLALQRSGGTSKCAGIIFLTVVFTSLCYVIGNTILTIAKDA